MGEVGEEEVGEGGGREKREGKRVHTCSEYISGGVVHTLYRLLSTVATSLAMIVKLSKPVPSAPRNM